MDSQWQKILLAQFEPPLRNDDGQVVTRIFDVVTWCSGGWKELPFVDDEALRSALWTLVYVYFILIKGCLTKFKLYYLFTYLLSIFKGQNYALKSIVQKKYDSFKLIRNVFLTVMEYSKDLVLKRRTSGPNMKK